MCEIAYKKPFPAEVLQRCISCKFSKSSQRHTYQRFQTLVRTEQPVKKTTTTTKKKKIQCTKSLSIQTFVETRQAHEQSFICVNCTHCAAAAAEASVLSIFDGLMGIK